MQQQRPAERSRARHKPPMCYNSLCREKGVNLWQSQPGAHALQGGGPAEPLPPHAAGRHAAHASEAGASGACTRLPAAPGSVRDAPVLPASTGDQSGAAVRAAQHWARRLHPLAQLQPSPGDCQLPPKLGLQRWGQEHREDGPLLMSDLDPL